MSHIFLTLEKYYANDWRDTCNCFLLFQKRNFRARALVFQYPTCFPMFSNIENEKDIEKGINFREITQAHFV